MRRESARAARLAADDSPWRSFACLFEGMALRLEGDRAGAREQGRLHRPGPDASGPLVALAARRPGHPEPLADVSPA